MDSSRQHRFSFLLVLSLLWSIGASSARARTTVEVTLTNLAQTYDKTQKSAGCQTKPANVATSITYKDVGSGTGRVEAGSYGVTCKVTALGKSGSATGTLVIKPASQTIAFAPIADQPIGTPPFALIASATSGLPVTFASNSPDVCTVAGELVSLVKAGTCSVTSSQDGDSNYLPAPTSLQTFNVTPASSELRYVEAYDSGFQGDWRVEEWDPIDVNPNAPAPGRTGTAIEVRHDGNGWGAAGLANMRDWNNVHYMYLNEFRTIEFDLYVEPDSTGIQNLYFILDDAGYCAEPPLVSFIPGWDPSRPQDIAGRWIPVRIGLDQIGATVPKFMRFLFFNASSSRPHYRLANVRLGWIEDLTPPQFTSVTATPNLTNDELTLAFTNDRATTVTKVEWGAGDYSQVINGTDEELTTSHSVVLAPVARGITYQYRITVAAPHSDPAVPPTSSVYSGTYTMPAVPTAPPVITAFTASPAEIAVGDASRLTWSVTGYDTLAIDQGVGSVAQIPGATGVSVAPTQTTTYTLTASNAHGTVTRTVLVTTHAVPTVVSFTAAPAKVGASGTSVLTWDVTNFESISIDHGVGVVTGIAGSTGVTVQPNATTTYVLTAANAYGTVRQTVTVTVETAPPANPIWVMGYYIGYHRGLQSPAEVDYGAMTHIIIGNVFPNADGTLDRGFAYGGIDWAKEAVQRAHAAGIKALLMVGGAGSIDGFRATSDPAKRASVVAALKALVLECGFDGIDLDWEPLDPDLDAATSLALVQALQAPDVLPRSAYIYTLPVGWNNQNYNPMIHPFYGQIAQHFDRVSPMSYSMMWLPGWESWHTGALVGNTPLTPSSIDNSVQALRASGIPASKIGIGIGFYGDALEPVPSASPSQYVTAPHQATDHAMWRFGDNIFSYSNIMQLFHNGQRYRWDDAARVPYLSIPNPTTVSIPGAGNVRPTYITYDDEQSIAEKGSYVRRNGLGGVMIWAISEGYLSWKTSGEKDPLMKAIVAAFRQP
jgi:chitinase